MITNLDHYVKHYNSFLDKEICNNTIKELEKCNWEEHKFYDSKSNEKLNFSGKQELDVTWDNISTTKIIMDKLWFKIKDYVDSLNFFVIRISVIS